MSVWRKDTEKLSENKMWVGSSENKAVERDASPVILYGTDDPPIDTTGLEEGTIYFKHE